MNRNNATREIIHPHENFAAYLYVIACNAVYKEMLRRLVTSANYIDFLTHASAIGLNSTEDVNFSLLEQDGSVIDRLPDSRRLIYLMSSERHMTNEEIARELNISPKTVETRS